MRFVQSVLLGLAFCQTAEAASYTVTLREFGFDRPTCTSDIQQAAQRFADASGAVILSSGCIPPDVGHINSTGKFTYAAADRVETTTTDVREAWGIDGYYRSPSECHAALAMEQEMFTRLTGLEPYVGYCYKANYISAPRYRVRMDAIGSSPIRKFSQSSSWSFSALDPSRLVTDVTAMVAAAGGEVVAAMVDRDVGGHLVAVDYYATEEIHMHSQELLLWQQSDDCQRAADDLNRGWDAGIVKSTFHCSVSTNGDSRLLQIYLSSNVLSGFDFDSDTYPTDYPTQSDCEADASRIEAALTQSGTQVLGTVCGQNPDADAWKIAVFSRD